MPAIRVAMPARPVPTAETMSQVVSDFFGRVGIAGLLAAAVGEPFPRPGLVALAELPAVTVGVG